MDKFSSFQKATFWMKFICCLCCNLWTPSPSGHLASTGVSRSWRSHIWRPRVSPWSNKMVGSPDPKNGENTIRGVACLHLLYRYIHLKKYGGQEYFRCFCWSIKDWWMSNLTRTDVPRTKLKYMLIHDFFVNHANLFKFRGQRVVLDWHSWF